MQEGELDMMTESVVGKLWQAFRQAFGKITRAGLSALIIGIVLVEGLALLWNAPHGAASGVDMTRWPPVFHATPPNLFVHLLAMAFGLLMAYLVAFTVAVVQTLRGVIFAAEHVDDVAGAIVDKSLDTLDAAVDTLDGPNRHGFRGKRGDVIVR